MIRSDRIWRLFALPALAVWLTLAAGFVRAVDETMGAPETGVSPGLPVSPAPTDGTGARDGELRIAALGDSLTTGVGDDGGKGYVGRVRERLEAETGRKAVVVNFSIPGLTTEGLLAQLGQQAHIGRTVAEADFVLLTIGGNDLFGIARDVFDFGQDTFDLDRVEARIPAAIANFAAVMDKLVGWNGQAPIVYIAPYNPFYDVDDEAKAARGVALWNARAMEVVAGKRNGVFIGTADLFQMQFSARIARDHFHPNERGYKAIAERVVQALAEQGAVRE